MINVVKRSGAHVPFDEDKIFDAILRASRQLETKNIDDSVIEELTKTVSAMINDGETISTREIQKKVEKVLLSHGEEELASRYSDYKINQLLDKLQDIESSVGKIIERDESVVHENANKDATAFNTQRDLTAGAVAKSYALKYMIPEELAKSHTRGEIHIHDLDYAPFQPMTNCCIPDVKSMLENGFVMGNAEIESPNSIQTASAQIAQIIANVASSQYGGTTIDRIDEILEPYAWKNFGKHMLEAKKWVSEDKQEDYAWEKTRKDIYDAVQALEYETNTLYTSNGQTPFITFGFGVGEGAFAKEIQKAILQVRLDGLGKDKRTAIFPKLVFGLKRGLNLEKTDPNYDVKQLALKCSAKRMYPDIISYDKLVELEGDYKAPMGCRSYLPAWIDPESGEYVNAGRNNLGVVTLNLPRIALESENSVENFWEIFEQRMRIVKKALVLRAQRCEEALPENAPIMYKNGALGYKAENGESVEKFFRNYRATVSAGYIGLYETATVFFGSDWEKNSEAKAFTLKILEEMNNHVTQWREEYPWWFSVYATPSESLTDRFCKIDREEFGNIEHVTDKGYYMNSFHYDVRKNPSPFEKIDFEKDYPQFSKGGFIHYCEYPVLTHNLEALETVWDYAYDRVAYLGTNTPIDECFECGFTGDFTATDHGYECAECGNNNPATASVTKRLCGYLGNPLLRPAVEGRRKEMNAREKHC